MKYCLGLVLLAIFVVALVILYFVNLFCELEELRQQCASRICRSRLVKQVLKTYDECSKLNIDVEEISGFVKKSTDNCRICGIPFKYIGEMPYFRNVYKEIISNLVKWLEKRKNELPNGRYYDPEKLSGSAAAEFAKLNKEYQRILKNI